MVWHTFDKAFNTIKNLHTVWGYLWFLDIAVLRIFSVSIIGEELFDDDQDHFLCDAQHPGCTAVCFNEFSPMAQSRFWAIEVLFCLVPVLSFHVYAHKILSQENEVSGKKVANNKKVDYKKIIEAIDSDANMNTKHFDNENQNNYLESLVKNNKNMGNNIPNPSGLMDYTTAGTELKSPHWRGRRRARRAYSFYGEHDPYSDGSDEDNRLVTIYDKLPFIHSKKFTGVRRPKRDKDKKTGYLSSSDEHCHKTPQSTNLSQKQIEQVYHLMKKFTADLESIKNSESQTQIINDATREIKKKTNMHYMSGSDGCGSDNQVRLDSIQKTKKSRPRKKNLKTHKTTTTKPRLIKPNQAMCVQIIYILHCWFKIIIDAIFIYLSYEMQVRQSQSHLPKFSDHYKKVLIYQPQNFFFKYNFNFTEFNNAIKITERFLCKHSLKFPDAPEMSPCSNYKEIACWVSRPQEKEYFVRYIVACQFLAIFICLCDIVSVVLGMVKLNVKLIRAENYLKKIRNKGKMNDARTELSVALDDRLFLKALK